MKHILIAFLLIAGFSAFAQQDALEASNVEKRTLTASFTKISVMDGIDLYLSQSKDPAVAVSASEEKYLKRIITEVENGTLKIYYDTKGPNFNGKKHLKAYVSFDQIDQLTASSGASVVLKDKITLNQLGVKLTSGAQLKGNIECASLAVEQNSGAETELSGTATKLQVEVSSGAVFKGYELNSDICNAKSSSGAGIRITVQKELTAKASSGGGIRYKGTPEIKDLNINSGGSIKKS